MAKKKDLTDAINENATPVYKKIMGAATDTTAEQAKEKEAERAKELQANKKKTPKEKPAVIRMNINIDADNYDFITTMSRLASMSYIKYINKMLTEYRESHQDIYLKAKELQKDL